MFYFVLDLADESIYKASPKAQLVLHQQRIFQLTIFTSTIMADNQEPIQ